MQLQVVHVRVLVRGPDQDHVVVVPFQNEVAADHVCVEICLPFLSNFSQSI